MRRLLELGFARVSAAFFGERVVEKGGAAVFVRPKGEVWHATLRSRASYVAVPHE